MKICWVGLGHMGLPMVTHIHARGFEVTGFDLSEEARAAAQRAGVPVARTLEDAARAADLVFAMLPEGRHVRSVFLDSELSKIARGALCVNSSTISPEEARQIAADLEHLGMGFVDAPVSGGMPGAIKGTLSFMVGGTSAQVEHVRPVLSAMGANIFHVGGTGCGQAAKVANNMLLAMYMASVSEAAVLAERLGLDPRTFWNLAQVSSGDSWVLRNFFPVPGVIPTAPASHDFAPSFTATLMRKDVELALSAARTEGVTVQMTEQAARMLDQLIEAGHADLDFSALVRIPSNEL